MKNKNSSGNILGWDEIERAGAGVYVIALQVNGLMGAAHVLIKE